MATEFFEQTIRVVGRDRTLRVLIASTGSPNCASLAMTPAMGLDGTKTDMCLFTNRPEVSGIGLNKKKKHHPVSGNIP